MGEVEAQVIRRNQGTSLIDVVTQDLAQGSLQEVRCRMVAGQVQMALFIDGNIDGIAGTENTFCNVSNEVY